MGRMKGTHLRSAAQKLMKDHSAAFSDKFGENSKKLESLGLVKSGKRERNKLAGELTNLKKRQNRKEAAEARAA